MKRVDADAAGAVLEHLRGPGGCAEACVVGAVRPRMAAASVVLKTVTGGHRGVEPLTGELLPRIC